MPVPAPIILNGKTFDREEDSESEDEDEDEHEDKEVELYSLVHGSNLNWVWALSEQGSLHEQDILSSILDRTRDNLLEGLMNQFWMTVNQRMSGSIRVHGGSFSTSLASISDFSTPHTESYSTSPGKRARKDNRGEFPEEDGERGPKKPRFPSTSPESLEEAAQFACPYRKHDPRKYNIRDWATCALTPHRTVARVK
jgi:hypothetical protein